MLRRILALFVFAAAALSGLMTLAASGSGVEHSIARSREIDGQFRRATARVATFEQARGRLPTAEEFNRSALMETSSPVLLAEPGFTDCSRDPATFARLRPPDYVLMLWRGEWMECYAPTRGLSTLALNPVDYTMLGSVARDMSLFASIAIMLLALAIWLWRRRSSERPHFL